jgi:hypothetical protein
MSVELLAIIVAIVNFVYVLLVSSTFNPEWFDRSQQVVGCVITVVAGFELLVRFNPLRIADFTPLTRLNTTFDGLALVGALISTVGIVMYAAGDARSLQFMLTGRAIDMTRIMRFFAIFRDVVRRSADVLPCLTGPVILVVTTLHIFVYCGMLLWGGAVEVGGNRDYTAYLYDLNNFNSYHEGAVTMFQVLVVNDWNEIAKVFLYADRCSSPYIVFPFFVIGNLLGVSIMLNVLTSFFVQAFITTLDEDNVVPPDAPGKIKNSKTNDPEKASTPTRLTVPGIINSEDHGTDADSEGSSDNSELFEFDVYEREGFDKIMANVAGNSLQSNNYAKDICNYLEIFESLAPERDPVGYLICDQLTLERFGNRRFQTKTEGFLELNELHVIVSDMHAELLVLSSRSTFKDRSLIRTYHHRQDRSQTLEISASLLRRHPALSLFVSRRKKKKNRGG